MKQKIHREFHSIAEAGDWIQFPGYPDGIVYKSLADNLDVEAGTGSRTRLIRWPPGAELPEPVVHPFCEEVFVIEGDFVVVDAATGIETEFPAHSYACRPDGIRHGPFRTRQGCLLLEMHYFEEGGFKPGEPDDNT